MKMLLLNKMKVNNTITKAVTITVIMDGKKWSEISLKNLELKVLKRNKPGKQLKT
jgi:hypothetical protein